MVSRSALPERRCMDRPLNTDRTGRKSCRKIKSIAKLNFLRIFSLGFPRWKYSGYFALHEPVHCQKVGKLRTTNIVEFQNKELKKRTRCIRVFPNKESLLRIATALLIELDEKWLANGKVYLKGWRQRFGEFTEKTLRSPNPSHLCEWFKVFENGGLQNLWK